MKKIIHPIDIKPEYREKFMRVFCEIKYIKGNLSISGVEGPRYNGDCTGGCGQIIMNYKSKKNGDNQTILTENKVIHISKYGSNEVEIRYCSGWDYKTFKKFIEVWDRWHLNNLRAGTPIQEDYLNNHENEFPGYPVSQYEWATNILNDAGLNPAPDKQGYLYGQSWLREEVPQDIIDFLFFLPDTDIAPAWV